MNRKSVVTVVATLALGAGLMGCSTAQKGAAAGGALGAVAGTVVGHNSASVGHLQGALIGGGAGAATGGLAGDAFAQVDNEDMQRQLDNLTAQLQAAEDELVALQSSGLTADKLAQLDQLQNDLNAAQSELDGKRAELDQLREDFAAAQATASQNEAELAQREADLQNTQARLDQLTQSLEESDQSLQYTTVERDEAITRANDLETKLAAAQDQLLRVTNQLDLVQTSLKDKEQAVDQLRSELTDLNVQLDETSRGLTLTIMNQLLYNPGAAELSDNGRELLGKVAQIIQANFPDRELLIEGHTDNQPIVHSGWQSNWELGAARSLSVLHELAGGHGFDPAKLSATSFGEHRPATSNATEEGRSTNRRAVIVILPEKMPVQRNQYAEL